MLENAWKAKLVRLFKKKRPLDFIWATEARLKSGYPDLYILKNGTPIHCELKSVIFSGAFERTHLSNYKKYFEPLQIEILKRISQAGAHAYGVIKYEAHNQSGVLVVRVRDGKMRFYSNSEFIDMFLSTRCDFVLPEV